jgi:hypothetical protein
MYDFSRKSCIFAIDKALRVCENPALVKLSLV